MWIAAAYRASLAGVAHRATMSAPERSRNSSPVIAEAAVACPRITAAITSSQPDLSYRLIGTSSAYPQSGYTPAIGHSRLDLGPTGEAADTCSREKLRITRPSAR